MIKGIHHITTISSGAQKTYDFYHNILGLRLVKKTVNFDAPDTYHLYFGNESGEPGTALTFFPLEDAGTGMRGTGQVTKIQFSVPMESLAFWIGRFQQFNVKNNGIEKQFGNSKITFYDFDGLQLELVMSNDNSKLKAWTKIIDEKYAIRGFFGAELSVDDQNETEKILIDVFGYKKVEEANKVTRFVKESAEFSKFIDLFEMKGWPPGRQGAGTVHHVAFGVKDTEDELKVRDKIVQLGIIPTDVIDRNYFKSVYFREPNGILFELATDEPGFTVDEDLDKLGTELKLPEKYEKMRKDINKILPPLKTKEDKSYDFDYYLDDKGSDKTIIMFHGTGGNEKSLIPLVEDFDKNSNLLGIKGNIYEGGLARYFKRKHGFQFDLDSIERETSKLKKFLNEISKDLKINLDNSIAIGYSNGANFISSFIFKNPGILKTAVLLHPMIPFELENKLDLTETKIFITTGKKDPFLRTPDEIEKLGKMFSSNGAKVEIFAHGGGHEIADGEIVAVEEWLG